MANNVKFTTDIDLLYANGTNLSIKDIPYRQAVGALLYATQCTRSNFFVSKMSQFMNCYSAAHWQGVEQIIRYVKKPNTNNLHKRYTRDNEIKNRNILLGYSDADWASDVDTRKSQSGYVFYLNGGPISWSSNKLYLPWSPSILRYRLLHKSECTYANY